MLLAYDSPELHPSISDQEKEYILEGSGHARATQVGESSFFLGVARARSLSLFLSAGYSFLYPASISTVVS